MLKRVLVTVVLAAVGLAVPTGPSHADPAPVTVTYATMSGTEHDYITGCGGSYFYGMGAGSVTVTGSVANGIEVLAEDGYPSDYYRFDFAAPQGQTLTAGEYVDAQRSSFRDPGHPGLDVYGNGRGCNELTGSFTVKEIAPDLSRLWIQFEQHCGPRDPSAAFGEIKINMPADPSGMEVAPTSIPWPDLPARDEDVVPVRVQNTGADPMTVTSANLGAGDDAFAIRANDCGTLAPGAVCEVDVAFQPALAGDDSGTLTLTGGASGSRTIIPLSGTAVADPVKASLATDRDHYGYGQTARLTTTFSGSWVDPEVALYRTLPGSARELVASGPADADGTFAYEVPVKRTAEFTAEWTDGDQGGSVTAYASVRPITLKVKPDRRLYHYGDRAHIEIHLTGNAPHRDVALYRQDGTAEPVLVARPEVDDSGLAVVVVPARTSSTFTAQWEDDGAVVAEHSNHIEVRAGVQLKGRGFHAVSGKFHLYRPGARIMTRGKVAPNKAGECVRFEVEYHRRWWRRLGRTDCVELSSTSRAGAYLSYDKRFQGLELRFAMEYDGDELNRGDWSSWFYARYSR